MPKLTRLAQFLKNNDAYAQPIQLSYMNQKQFPTIFGGVLTMLHFLIFISFFAVVTKDLVNVNFNISTFQESNVQYGTRPIYEYDSSIMIPAFALTQPSLNTSTSDIFKYFGAYYTQKIPEENGGSKWLLKHYNVTSCKNIFGQIDNIFGENDDNIMCPDLKPEEFIALGGEEDLTYEFQLTIGLCEKVQKITYSEDCVNKEESLNQLPLTQFDFRQANMLSDGFYFINNSVRKYNLIEFSIDFNQNYSSSHIVNINPISASYSYNWFVGAFQQGLENLTETALISPPNYESFKEDNIVKFHFQLTNIINQNQWSRVSFMSMAGNLGGITALLVFILNSFTSAYANFAIDNSMVNKIYQTPKSKFKPSQDATISSINGEDPETLLGHGETSKNYIFQRNNLHYSNCLAVLDYIKTNICCCFCNKLCCKQSKENRAFKRGQSLLYGEMDIIRLVKMMRFAKFLSIGMMKPIHWQMVQKFDEYTVKDSSCDESSSDSSSDEKISENLNQDDEQSPFNQFEDQKLSWYLKSNNQKMLAHEISVGKFNAREKKELEDQLLKLQQLSSMYLFKMNYTPEERAKNEGLKRLDLLAIKLLVGKDWKGDETIQDAIQESTDSIETLKRQVYDMIDSTQGSNILKQLSGPKFN